MAKRNILVSFLSFILSLMLTLSLIVAIPMTVISKLLTEDNIEILVNQVVNEIDTDGFAILTSSGGRSIANILLWTIKDCPGAEYITEAQIERTLVPEFVKSLAVSFAADFSEASEDGEIEIKIKPSEIYKFLEKNRKTVSELAADSGYRYEIDIKGNKDMILINITELFGKDGITVESMVEDDDLIEDIVLYLEYAQKALSKTALYFVWGAVGAISVLLFLVNIGYLGSFLSACGSPAFIIGLLYTLLAVAVKPLLSALSSSVDDMPQFIHFAAGWTAAILMDVSLVVLAAGFGLIILSAIVKAIVRKNQN